MKNLSAEDKVKILRASGDELTRLEQAFGVKQVEVVDHLIENTCWSNDPKLRGFLGKKGTNARRRWAILNAFNKQDERQRRREREDRKV